MAAKSAVTIMIIHAQPNILRGFDGSVLISGMMAQSLTRPIQTDPLPNPV
jgi:hypothetical protein